MFFRLKTGGNMTLEFKCPECGELIGANNINAGEAVQCPKCKNRVEIPADNSEAKDSNIDNLVHTIDNSSEVDAKEIKGAKIYSLILFSLGAFVIILFAIIDISGTFHGKQAVIKNIFINMGFSYDFSCLLHLLINKYTFFGYSLIIAALIVKFSYRRFEK